MHKESTDLITERLDWDMYNFKIKRHV